MNYFSGFSLQTEGMLFSEYTLDSCRCVAGFSYGAQNAFEYVYTSKTRIDRLVLISPAFFQTQKPSFVRTQLRYFQSDKEAYVTQFLKNASYPSKVDLSEYLNIGTYDELEALLTYKWDKEKIKSILDRDITIEVFLGAKDKIIHAKDAYTFFSSVVTTYYDKNTGHIQKD